MKKFILLVSVGVFLAASSPALAALDQINPGKLGKESVAKMRQTTRQEKIGQLINQVTNRLGATTAKIEQLLARVENRISTMETAGKNVAAAKAEVSTAKTAITAAKEAVSNLTPKLPALSTASTTPKQARDAYRASAQEVAAKVRAAHRAVVEVISLLNR